MMYYFNGEKRLRALTRANTAASLVGAPKRYLKRFLRIPEAGMRAAAFEQQHATRSGFRFAKRVVIKVGTPVATHIDGNIALGRIGALVEQIAQLRQEGRDVVVITSGAIGTGSARMRRASILSTRLGDSLDPESAQKRVDENAAAAVGQSMLMNMYETLFARYNMSCAQVLVTESDIDDEEMMAHVRDTTAELLQLGCVPVVNENDATTGRKEAVLSKANEVTWDNDALASKLAAELRADLLLLLTDMDGLYAQPATGGGAPTRLACYVPRTELARSGLSALATTSELRHGSSGASGAAAGLSDEKRGEFSGRTRMAREGLAALVDAACFATAHGVRAAVVTTGHHPRAVVRVLRGEDVGTVFLPPPAPSKL